MRDCKQAVLGHLEDEEAKRFGGGSDGNDYENENKPQHSFTH